MIINNFDPVKSMIANEKLSGSGHAVRWSEGLGVLVKIMGLMTANDLPANAQWWWLA
jgi:hypothetical protein